MRIVLLLCALLQPVLSSAANFDSTNPARIYMVLWRGCEEACQGFKQQLAAQQLPVEIIERNAARDKSKLPTFLSEAKALRPDLVVTWGTSVSKAMLGPLESDASERYLGDIPALFMIVADPVGAGIIRSYSESGRRYITGTRNRVPEEVQLRTILEYLGKERPKLGVIYSSAELNSVLNNQKLASLQHELGFELATAQYQLDTEGKPLAGQIEVQMRALAAQQVDLVYVGSSSYNRAKREQFIAAADRHGLAVASAYEVMVTKSGALLAVANRYYNVGKLAAKQARRVLFESAIPGELPIPSLSRYSIFINMDSARRHQIYPPIQLLRLAELVNPMP
ncbi:MAG: ABC transporter substrate-binding protein [Pseudomonadales bacterium]